MRGRAHARRTLKGLVADLRVTIKNDTKAIKNNKDYEKRILQMK